MGDRLRIERKRRAGPGPELDDRSVQAFENAAAVLSGSTAVHAVNGPRVGAGKPWVLSAVQLMSATWAGERLVHPLPPSQSNRRRALFLLHAPAKVKISLSLVGPSRAKLPSPSK
jgi:hypothetical protein